MQEHLLGTAFNDIMIWTIKDTGMYNQSGTGYTFGVRPVVTLITNTQFSLISENADGTSTWNISD